MLLPALLAVLLGLQIEAGTGAASSTWERDGLEGRQVRALAVSTDGATFAALVGGARDQSPLWLRDQQGWSQPASGLPRFVLGVEPAPEGGWYVSTGRDLSDQPGIFHLADTSAAPRRLYDTMAIAAMWADGSGGLLAASAPWADREQVSELSRRDPATGTWSVVLRGTLICGSSASHFRQIVSAQSAPQRVLALEWCQTDERRQTQLWRSDDRGLTWRVVAATTARPDAFALTVFDPSNEAVVYAAPMGGQSGSPPLMRSQDGGQSWAQHGAGLETLGAVRSLLIDRRQPRRFILGTERAGVFLSEDGGLSWRPLPGLEGVRVGALVMDDLTGRLYAATADGVWHSALP